MTLGRAGLDDPEQQVTVALGRDDGPATYLVDEQNVRLSVREAAQTLYVSGPEMSGARAAVLDGLEQSERAAGRTPADPCPCGRGVVAGGEGDHHRGPSTVAVLRACRGCARWNVAA